MVNHLHEMIEWYKDEYLEAPVGQDQLAQMETESREVKRMFKKIQEKRDSDEDITENVLKRLLPHTDSEYHRENGYRISTWAAVRKDVRGWFEGGRTTLNRGRQAI